MRFRYFKHTADAKFRAYGTTPEEQFSNAALATFSLMFAPEQIPQKKTLRVFAAGKDLQQLLYHWIEELLFLLDTKNFVLHAVKKIKISKQKNSYFLKAEIFGAPFKETFEHRGHVKAATYAEMEITPRYVQMVVDI